MRLTPLRQAMLAFLATQRMPVSLEMIAQADGVRGQCDAGVTFCGVAAQLKLNGMK